MPTVAVPLLSPRQAATLYRELRAFLRDLDGLKLAATETGLLDFWQCQHDEAAGRLRELEATHAWLIN